MREHNIREEAIRHLIITHGHADHFRTIDILEFASRLSRPLIVYGDAMVRDALDFAARNR